MTMSPPSGRPTNNTRVKHIIQHINTISNNGGERNSMIASPQGSSCSSSRSNWGATFFSSISPSSSSSSSSSSSPHHHYKKFSTSALSPSFLPIHIALILMGYIAGFSHGRLFAIPSQDSSPSHVPCDPPMLSSSNSLLWTGKEHHEGTNSGWKSIHVHFGTRDHLTKHPADKSVEMSQAASEQSTIPQETHSEHVQRKEGDPTIWYSQARQDEIVMALLNGKKSGYFVDLAANDATHWSNTYAMEESYDWDGLCIEPNPMYWKNLSYRKCTVVAAVVGGETRDDDVYFRYDAGTHGGLAGQGFDNGPRWRRHSQAESTVPLAEIFAKAQVPRNIDYLSLDVEGAENLVMTAFPLSQYRIQIITGERLRGPIRGFLKQHGYEFIKRITRWGESLWIHNDTLRRINLDVLDQFSFPVV